MKLDLAAFRPINVQRATEGFKCYDNQPLTYWTTALAGEVGELCNMIKEEIGGIAIYLDLLASLLDISLEEAIVDTFNSKSEKYGFKEKLEATS